MLAMALTIAGGLGGTPPAQDLSRAIEAALGGRSYDVVSVADFRSKSAGPVWEARHPVLDMQARFDERELSLAPTENGRWHWTMRVAALERGARSISTGPANVAVDRDVV